VTPLRKQLERLDAYQAAAVAGHLPALIAIDEGSVEASTSALPSFLGALARPLSFPVAVDRDGRIADGYEVHDLPWLVLVSTSGRVLWYHDISVAGWPTTAALTQRVRAALAHERR